MAAFIPYNTVQKARVFLDSLGERAPAFAGTHDVLAQLLANVKARRNDPKVRERLLRLVEELSTQENAGRSQLPDSVYAAVDSNELADELRLLLDGPSGMDRASRQRYLIPLLVLAILLLGLAMNMGCVNNDDDDDTATACIDDMSLEHFSALIAQSDQLTDAQSTEAADDYDALTTDEQEDVIQDLCGMDPEDIAAYLENRFGGDDDDTTDDDNDMDDDTVVDDDTFSDDDVDDDAVYKGVAFVTPKARKAKSTRIL